MVQKKDTEVLPGRWCFHVPVLFSLHSRQGLPQWILSHFRQAPPLTDHTAAFKGLNEHQRQLWFCIPVKSITNSGASPKWKPPLAPTAIFNDFLKTHSGFSDTACHSGRVKWDTRVHLCHVDASSHSPHDARVPPVSKGRLVWIRRQRARVGDNGTVCINDSVAGCAAQNIIYSSHWTAAILFRSRKISWPSNT